MNEMKTVQSTVTPIDNSSINTEYLSNTTTTTEQVTTEPLTEKRLRSLSELANTGRVTEEVDILGWLFRLKTLTVAQSTEVFQSIANIVDLPMRANKYRVEVLARAIETVNNVPLENIYEGPKANELTALEKRRIIINSWDQSFLMKVFDVYSKLLDKSLAIVNLELGETELKKNLDEFSRAFTMEAK